MLVLVAFLGQLRSEPFPLLSLLFPVSLSETSAAATVRFFRSISDMTALTSCYRGRLDIGVRTKE